MELGYFLSSEEQKPNKLISYAQTAEQSGFKFIVVSDHFHPWVSQQGESSFVWSVLGGIAQATEHVHVGTAVTCPIMRFHPALAAQAAATVADMMPGRFFLGLGTGEYLNEHIFGYPWPGYDIRREMLIEAIHVIRELWKGDEFSFYGSYFTVHDARIYTLPEKLPPIYLAASGPETASLAGQICDGLISTTPGDEIVNTFKENGGSGKPCYGQVKVCWASLRSPKTRSWGQTRRYISKPFSRCRPMVMIIFIFIRWGRTSRGFWSFTKTLWGPYWSRKI